MSIIHQALKKIEGVKHGYNPKAGGTAYKGPGGGGLSLKRAVPVLLITVLTLGVLALYLHNGSLGLLIKGPWAESKGEIDAAVVSSAEAGGPGDIKAASIEAGPAQKKAPRMIATERNSKGVELFRAGLYREAAAEFTGAVGLEPGEGVYHNNLALAYSALDDLSSAKAHLKEALKLSPVYPEALNNLGALLAEEGRDKEAMEMFSRALSFSPGMTDAHLNLAATLEKRGDYREALKHYEEYVRITGPGSPGGRINDLRKKMLRIKTMLLTGYSEEKTELQQ